MSDPIRIALFLSTLWTLLALGVVTFDYFF